jgi:Zn-dependent protease with chaperone function
VASFRGNMSSSLRRSQESFAVEPWPTERPLFLLALLVSLALWVVATITIIGLVYAAIFALLFFVMHVAFVAYVRGSAVRLGSDQFPELHAAVVRMAGRIGLDPVPEAYLMQAGGALNAFATRFLRTHIVVLFSDLLDACGDNTAARDMIIAHELGHVHRGHLRWHWVLLPAHIIPFLAQALSRAREYTCDRYGLAGAGNTEGALLGLAILSAGGKHGPLVNRRAFVSQRAALNTGWMTLGEWLGTHPPLAKRMIALDPSLIAGTPRLMPVGALRAAAIIGLVLLPIGVGTWVGAAKLPALLEQAKANSQVNGESSQPAANPLDSVQVSQDLDRIGDFLLAEQAAGRGLPTNSRDLWSIWKASYPGQAIPKDAYDGTPYGYYRTRDGFVLWSSGPDRKSDTEDDIEWRSSASISTR